MPVPVMAVVFAAFLLAASWEWARLADWHSQSTRWGYLLLTGALAVLIYHYLDTPGLIATITGVACGWWGVAFVWIVVYEKGGPPLPRDMLGMSVVGCLVVLPAWAAVIALLKSNAVMLLVLFVLIWSADAAAYFVGRRWGKHRLAPRVSPGKTWEGFGAALAVSVPMGAVMGRGVGLSGKSTIVFCGVALVTVMISIVGDLVESMYKRQRGVKDSGTLLPGHGGILDRIDSFLAAAPVFVFSLNLMWD